jgi:tetratricopeptide (TPR) repeat protein
MAPDPTPESHLMKPIEGPRHDWLRTALIVIALVYAILAGLRTVSETDLGWQMATGRYIVQHHQIPSTTLFTYTVPGSPWVYPPLSGIIFYFLFLVGGYAALSWLSALACAATLALALWRGGRLTAALAILAVPAVAFRTMPRADLFTTVLFAAVLALLWRYHEGTSVRLWLLPLLMLLWTNLHHGFVAGLALMGGYVFIELCDVIFVERRAAALKRLRNAFPWIVVSGLATLVNPWGIGIYRALARQNTVTQSLTDFIGEWSGVHFNSLALRQFFSPRDPASADWWIMALTAIAIVVCLWKKRLGPAVLLAGALYESIKHIRFQAILAVFVVVIGGAVLPHLLELFPSFRKATDEPGEDGTSSPRWLKSPVLEISIVALFALFAGVRSYDLVSNKYYLDAGQTMFFGAGESWWFPERAMEFLEREKLPANLFHDYNVGGYLNWRVGEHYPDFADGRYIPFAGEIFLKQRSLLAASPDSLLWQTSADRWNINTIVLSLSRYAGLNAYPLVEYCHSKTLSPVYADDVSIIFVRNKSEYADLLGGLRIDCGKVVLPEPSLANGESWRARAERFNFLMNSASVYYILSRDAEALSALQKAEAMFPDNANLHLVKAQFFQANNHLAEAEHEYLLALGKEPSDAGWFALATLYNSQHRYSEAAHCVTEAIGYSQIPYERLRSLGLVRISMNQPKDALIEFERAERKSPYRNDTSDEARSFNARLAIARARAYRAMNDLPHAVEEQQRATELTPENPQLWDTLAELFEAKGDSASAADARKHASSLRTPEAAVH